MDLLQNPFHTLAASPRDDRRRITDLAEDRSLLLDPGECMDARSVLTSPRKRLSAEVAWLPGIGPKRAGELLSVLEASPADLLAVDDLSPIAKANMLAAGIVRLPDLNPDDIAGWILQIARAFERVDPEGLRVIINEERRVSGFPEVTDLSALESEIEERRRYYCGVIKAALDKLSPQKLVKAVNVAVEDATDGGEHHGPILIDDLIDAYEVEAQGFLDKERGNIESLVERLHSAVDEGRADATLRSMVDQLVKVVKNWDVVAQPIQVSAKSRGLDHHADHRVARLIRSLAFHMYNEHGKLDFAQQLTSVLQEVFAEVGKVAEQADKDEDAFDEIAEQRSQNQRETATSSRQERRPTSFSPPTTMTSSARSVDGPSEGVKRRHIFAVALISVLLLGYLITVNVNSSAPSAGPRSSSQRDIGPSKSRAQSVPRPSVRHDSKLEYALPSPGTSNVLTVPEIRWCIREGIRIQAMRDVIDTNEGIDVFNRIVDDYNCRCGSYRYREGEQSKAERDIEPYRSQIVDEAVREAWQLGRSYRPSHPLVSSGTPTSQGTKDLTHEPLSIAEHTRDHTQSNANTGDADKTMEEAEGLLTEEDHHKADRSRKSIDLKGKVIEVESGDTLVILYESKKMDVRLLGIDAPEPQQSYGAEAKSFVRGILDGKVVTLRALGTDNRGRVWGDILIPTDFPDLFDDRNVNAEIVEAGYAWWHEKSAPDNMTLKNMESHAKAAKLGLWADRSPLPPWEFRLKQYQREQDRKATYADASRVKLGSNATTSRGFTQGSHKDDVLRLQGTPSSIKRYEALGHETWEYGLSRVEISTKTGRVIEWDNSGNLKAYMKPGSNVTTSRGFTQGSHKDDVLRLQGTPSSIKRYQALGHETWEYGLSRVEISTKTGRVIEWDNGGNLKVY